MAEPSAKRILQFIRDLDGQIDLKQTQLREMEIYEKSTPQQLRRAGFGAEKAKMEGQIASLKRGRLYWKGRFDQQMIREGIADPNESVISPDAPPAKGKIRAAELGIPVPDEPWYNPWDPYGVPSSAYVSPGPSGQWGNVKTGPQYRRVPMPQFSDDEQGRKQRREWLSDQWVEYWKDRQGAYENYRQTFEDWCVEKHFWQRRRMKALQEGKPFHEPAPPEPKRPVIKPPDIPYDPDLFDIPELKPKPQEI